jgi:integrase/recombinase XerD
MLGRQAKVLSDMQIKAVLSALDGGRNGLRNKVMFLLSLHGLRAKEISALEVSMVTDAEGRIADSIRLENRAAKGVSGRVIPMSDVLRRALTAYLDSRERGTGKFVVATERRERFSAHAVVVFFARLYKRMGFQGATSHSGRRTYITRAARKISQAGGSLRDVQLLAGHSHLSTTQRYIEQDGEAQRKVTAMLYE